MNVSRLPWLRRAGAVVLASTCLSWAHAANINSAPLTQRPFSPPRPLAQELRPKMKSPLVRELQIRLRHAKFLAMHDADDTYNQLTREGVRKFQKEHLDLLSRKIENQPVDEPHCREACLELPRCLRSKAGQAK